MRNRTKSGHCTSRLLESKGGVPDSERIGEMFWRRLWWWILASIKVALTKTPYMNRSFVIVSSARSGSTLLVQLLNNNKGIVCESELLNRELLEYYQLKGADERTLTNYILSMLLPLKLWLPFKGFKLFNEQLEYCNLPLQQVLDSLHSPPVIVLYRQNLLETYVSLQIAFQTNLWYSEDDVNDSSVKVDWNEFYFYAECEKRRWKRTMSTLKGVNKIIISYDELTGSKREETIHKLFAFLNLMSDRSQPLVAKCIRQNPLQLKEKVVNYHEIMQHLQESGYSVALDLNSLL